MGELTGFFRLNLYDLALEAYGLLGGRTSRRDYWMFVLPQAILFSAAVSLAMVLSLVPAAGPYAGYVMMFAAGFLEVILLFPNFVLAARRLHDADMSAWWLLLCPSGAGVFLLALAGTPGPNRFGPGTEPEGPVDYGSGGHYGGGQDGGYGEPPEDGGRYGG
jgi:uncharacterized membrane protein YhaH (DUF805 family)